MKEEILVDVKIFDTTNEHSMLYGFTSHKPLWIQMNCVNSNEQGFVLTNDFLQGVCGSAKVNQHDLIFGHISKKFKPSIYVDLIKAILEKNGFSTIEGNDDFYKKVE